MKRKSPIKKYTDQMRSTGRTTKQCGTSYNN